MCIESLYVVDMPAVYLASPYGFTEAGRHFLERILIPLIKGAGYDILDPWRASRKLKLKIDHASTIADYDRRAGYLKTLNGEIARKNREMIRRSDIVVAVLDGQEVDSGVAAEVGFAYGIGKKVIGYRGDFRQTGDNIGCKVNLQLEFFIEESGGEVVGSIGELREILGQSGRRMVREPSHRGG